MYKSLNHLNEKQIADLMERYYSGETAECVEYLVYQLDNVGFEFTAGEKTYKTFEIILEDFSVSQIYGIIWKAVEQAKIKGWDLKGYSRIKDLPQSALSLFFFNRVLSIGDMGFTLPPTIV